MLNDKFEKGSDGNTLFLVSWYNACNRRYSIIKFGQLDNITTLHLLCITDNADHLEDSDPPGRNVQ